MGEKQYGSRSCTDNCKHSLNTPKTEPCLSCRAVSWGPDIFSNYEPEEATPLEVSPVTKFSFTKGISGKEEE
jgi:hypothetical protein